MERVELNQRQIDYIDDVYNAVYDCILTITNKSTEEFPWNMYYIGECTELLLNKLLELGAVDKIYFPAVVEDKEGNCTIEKYYTLDKKIEVDKT